MSTLYYVAFYGKVEFLLHVKIHNKKTIKKGKIIIKLHKLQISHYYILLDKKHSYY